MNLPVSRTIHGHKVSARPVYKDGVLPAYWTATINNRTLYKTFSSVNEVFKFAERYAAR